MTNQKNSSIPATEAPPTPGDATTHPLAGFMQGSAQESESLNQLQETPASNPSSRKRMPLKFVLIGLAALVFIILFTFTFIALKSSQKEVFYGKDGELVWWGIEHDEEVYKPLIEEFEKTHNVKITYIRESTTEYRDRLSNALSAGKGPDIFEIHNTWPKMLASNLYPAPANILLPDEFKNSFYPVINTDLNLNGSILALPIEYDALTLYINEDIFSTALKSPPTNWDEFEKLAGELTVKESNKTIVQSGAAMGITQNVDYWPDIIGLMLYQNKANPGKLSGDISIDVFSYYTSFRNLKIWDTTLSKSTSTFAKGKLAMYFGPIRSAQKISEENSNLHFRTVPLPQLRKSKSDDPNFSYATYWAEGVWSKSVNRQIAWEFLKFITSTESLQKINAAITEKEGFARVYPRPEMNTSLRDDRILGSVVYLANNAKSWYLADQTFDGNKGINSQVNGVFKGAIDSWKPQNAGKIFSATNTSVSKIIAGYKTVKK
jgi:ABC-type glycerol-3-phosphate transport system substrate-binding protein